MLSLQSSQVWEQMTLVLAARNIHVVTTWCALTYFGKMCAT